MSITAGAVGYVASLVSTFILYPYRDYVKGFNLQSIPRVNPVQYSLVRYRGMLGNPIQPVLLALPWGLLYGGFVLGSGAATGAIIGGVLHGMGKVSIRTIARRLGGPRGRYDREVYTSFRHCLISSTKQYGVFSFFSGVLATTLISTVWHGASLVALQRSWSENFFKAWWDGFRIHAFLTFATNPLRNTFRSALYNTERAGGVHTLKSFTAGEAAIFREAAGVLRNMLRTEGVPFFLNGVMRTTFKTSIPFGFTYAVFRSLGGSIGGSSSNRNQHNHHHLQRRRFI